MSAKKEINKIQDLPYYREEYTAQLADLGIKELDELLEALQDKDRKKAWVMELMFLLLVGGWVYNYFVV